VKHYNKTHTPTLGFPQVLYKGKDCFQKLTFSDVLEIVMTKTGKGIILAIDETIKVTEQYFYTDEREVSYLNSFCAWFKVLIINWNFS